MRIAKYGRLFWLHLDCPDIDKQFLVRLARKLGICYIPWTLKTYRRLFMREDKSQYARLLINYCRKYGVETYVVQEGIGSEPPFGHLPLHADYFLSTENKYNWWLSKGMPKSHMRIYKRDFEAQDCKGIVFLAPLATSEDFLEPAYRNGHNERVMRAISEYLYKPVVFKPHPKDAHLIKPLLPKHRIVEGNALDLIRKYETIYTFADSSITVDCLMAGKHYIEI